jgi:predicted MFS family arabinose efflux permease
MAEEKQVTSSMMLVPFLLLCVGVMGLVGSWLGSDLLFGVPREGWLYVFTVWTLGGIGATLLARRKVMQQRQERESRSKSEHDLTVLEIAALKEEMQLLKSGSSDPPVAIDSESTEADDA